MVMEMALAELATGALAPWRSPACGVALPDFEMRAVTTTFGKAESFAAGDMAMLSSSANLNGRSRTLRLKTASGIAGPSAARANTNTVSSGDALPASAAERLTVPCTPFDATLLGAERFLFASSTLDWMVRASSESGGTSGSMRSQYRAALR